MSRLVARLAAPCALALGAGLAAPAAATPAADTVVVSTQWLAEHLHDPNLVVIQVGPREAYDAEHIPGTRYLATSAIAMDLGGLDYQVAPVDQLEDAFEQLGVTDASRIVVVFGATWVTSATRTVLTLHYLGLGARTSLLDGGFQAWKAEGRPVTAEVPAVARGDLTPRPRGDVVVTAEWVRDRLDAPHVAVIDARTPEFYTGLRGGFQQPRAGHIVGAGNVPFTTVVDDESFRMKDLAALRSLFEQAGARPGDTVVTYCHIGQQATLVYLAARSLGYEARMFDGSFQEWSRRDELPVVRPAAGSLPQLISTDGLAALLAAGASVIDARGDLNAYLANHVPGAAYLHYESLRATAAGVPGDVLPAESYAALFGRLGVSRDRPVVIYSDGPGQNFNATFVAWILTGFGHPSVHLLDGGYAKWEAERRELSRDYPAIEPVEFAAEPYLLDVVPMEWVQRALEMRDHVVLVDVRPPAQYAGEAGAQRRRGHIPGAINHFWATDLVDSGGHRVWKPVADLQRGYEERGITKDKLVVLYCNTGTEASHAYFALRNLLEYPNVRVYVPSWTEWAARDDLPIETGAAPAGT